MRIDKSLILAATASVDVENKRVVVTIASVDVENERMIVENECVDVQNECVDVQNECVDVQNERVDVTIARSVSTSACVFALSQLEGVLKVSFIASPAPRLEVGANRAKSTEGD